MLLQGPAQAQNIKDSLAEINSDIVVKVREPSPAGAKLRACFQAVRASRHVRLLALACSGAQSLPHVGLSWRTRLSEPHNVSPVVSTLLSADRVEARVQVCWGCQARGVHRGERDPGWCARCHLGERPRHSAHLGRRPGQEPMATPRLLSCLCCRAEGRVYAEAETRTEKMHLCPSQLCRSWGRRGARW